MPFAEGLHKVACNVQGLATWRYSVLRQPGLKLIKDMTRPEIS